MIERCIVVGANERGKRVHIVPGAQVRRLSPTVPLATAKCPHCAAPLCEAHDIAPVWSNCYKLLGSKPSRKKEKPYTKKPAKVSETSA